MLVGTEKRERQKANRAAKQQAAVRNESRSRGLRIAMIIVGAFVAVFGLVWIASLVTGDDDNDTPAAAEQTPVDAAPDETESDADATSAPADDAEAPTGPVTETIPDDCPPADGVGEPVREFAAAPPMCLDPLVDYGAVFTTNKGTFTIDLDEDGAPATTNNFVFLARNNYFDGTVCHRIIPGFVVQCGDPTATGTGGPGYRFDDELPEPGAYRLGSLAMANSGPNTNGSQFFIITGDDGAALPPQYALFGNVEAGFDDTVLSMEAAGTPSGQPTEPVEIQSVEITTG